MSKLKDKQTEKDKYLPPLLRVRLNPKSVNYVVHLAGQAPAGKPFVITINARSQNIAQDVYDALVDGEQLRMPRKADLAARDLGAPKNSITTDEEDRREFSQVFAHLVAPMAAMTDVVRIICKLGHDLVEPYNQPAPDAAGSSVTPALCAVLDHDKHGLDPDLLIQRFALQPESRAPKTDPIRFGLTFLAQFGKIDIDQAKSGSSQSKLPNMSAKDLAILNAANDVMKALDERQAEAHSFAEQENLKTARDAMQTFVYMFIIEREWLEHTLGNFANTYDWGTPVDMSSLPMEGQIERMIQSLEVVNHIHTLPPMLAEALQVYKERQNEFKENLVRTEDLEADAKIADLAENDSKRNVVVSERQARNEIVANQPHVEPHAPVAQNVKTTGLVEQPVPADS